MLALIAAPGLGPTLKSVLCAMCVLLSLPVLSSSFRRRVEDRSTSALLLVGFVTSRLIVFLAARMLAPYVPRGGDVLVYYFPQARAVFHGAIPYIDFPSSYGPLFPYLAGSLFFILGETDAAVAAVMIAFEVAAVLLLVGHARRHGSVKTQADMNVVLYLYTFNPAAIYWSGVAASNGVVILLSWTAGVLLLARRRPLAGILTSSCSVFACKMLGALAIPVLALDRRVKSPRAALGLFVPAATMVALWGLGLDVWQPLRREASTATSGNIWFFIAGILPQGIPLQIVAGISLAASAGALLAVLRWVDRPEDVMAVPFAAISSVCLLFLVLSMKSFPYYLLMFLLPLIWVAVRHFRATQSMRPVITILILGALSVIEPMLWDAARQPRNLSVAMAAKGSWRLPLALAGVDALLIAGYLYLTAVCLSHLFPGGRRRMGGEWLG